MTPIVPSDFETFLPYIQACLALNVLLTLFDRLRDAICGRLDLLSQYQHSIKPSDLSLRDSESFDRHSKKIKKKITKLISSGKKVQRGLTGIFISVAFVASAGCVYLLYKNDGVDYSDKTFWLVFLAIPFPLFIASSIGAFALYWCRISMKRKLVDWLYSVFTEEEANIDEVSEALDLETGLISSAILPEKKEMRKYPRLCACNQVKIIQENETWDTHIYDLSEGGFRFYSETEPRSEFRFSINMSQGSSIDGKAKPVWANSGKAGSFRTGVIGAKITQISTSDREIIRSHQ